MAEHVLSRRAKYTAARSVNSGPLLFSRCLMAKDQNGATVKVEPLDTTE